MRTIFVVVMLALLTIAFEIYSEAALMGRAVPHAEPDPATLAIGCGVVRTARSLNAPIVPREAPQCPQ
jgi:hypothetical protein